MNSLMWSKFDMVAVADYTGYTVRHGSMIAELHRVGIEDVETFWQYPTPYDQLMMYHLLKSGGVSRIGTFSCTMGHYRILKTAYELGKGNLLVMEDDCRWMTDTVRLEKMLAAIPEDADFCKFEWFFGRSQTPEERREILSRPKINDCWIDGHDVKAVGAGACYYGRKAMKWKIDLIEDAARRPGVGKLRVIDMYDRPRPLGQDIRAYLAVPLAAVQADHPEGAALNEASKDYALLTESGTTKGYGGR